MAPSASGVALAVTTAAAAGLVGAYALMRRMTLAADALSHVALPGIGVALLLGIAPLAGAAAALLLGAWIVWALEHRTGIATETVLGVVFTVALAVGALLTTGEELIDALFGAPGPPGPVEWRVGVLGAAAVTAFAVIARHRLVVTLVSRDIALTAGIRVRRLELAFLLAFALTVALGLRYLGVLLMGSLMIIPAATARRLARGLTGMLVWSGAVAMAATIAGMALAARAGLETGPVIVLVAAVLFGVTLVRRAPA